MSGVVGVFHRDKAIAQPILVKEMLETIVHRGPDASGVWADGSAGFGHCMLWTTPESLYEILPHRDTNARLVITCDARIDNRQELIEGLGLSRSSAKLTDSDLILAAYEKWGEDCPAKLIGDFVFAIWDQRLEKLFCARDPMGIKCLYYYVSKELFAFASEIKALTCVPAIPKRLNETRVLDYLINLFDDRTITFYRDICRLPSATSLSVTRESIQSRIYWTLDSARELKLSSDKEYTEAFKSCFVESVRCRMRSAYPVVSALSGGLDSSSIACVARDLQRANSPGGALDTISLIFPGLPQEDLKHIDERPFIEAVLATGGFRPQYVRADELSPMKDVQQIQSHLDEAFFAGNLYLHWEMYRRAQQNGNRVFLDGLDGDSTVSHGFELLADLIVGFRFPTLVREVNLIKQNLRLGRKRVIRDFCIMPLCPTWVYTAWDRLHGKHDDTRVTANLLNPEFRERLRLTERVDKFLVRSRSCLVSAREKHSAMLGFPLFAHALEMSDKCSAAFSLETRFPFFDRRLLELCVSLPANQKLGQGWSRLILRRAMEGILPDAVQWRRAKGNLSPNFYRRLLGGDREVLEEVLNQPSTLEAYIDVTAIRAAYQRYTADPLRCHDDALQIFAAVNLALWLKTAQLAP